MARNKIKRVSTILFLVFFLTGCKDAVNEVFNQGQYTDSDFLANYYSYYPEELRKNVYSTNETIIDIDVSDKTYSFLGGEAKEKALIPDYQEGLISKKELKEKFGIDLDENTVEEVLNNQLQRVSWYDYSKYYNLSDSNYGDSKINDSFKRGYFSKMTDGLINCFGFGAIARIQTDENGFGVLFKHELVEYTSFFVSLRGATNIDEGLTYNSDLEFRVSFYIEESASMQPSKVTFKMDLNEIYTDGSGNSNVIYFRLKDVLTQQQLPLLKRTTGFSFSFTLKEHGLLCPGGVANTDTDYKFALMLYELMLPHSKWR